MSKDELADRAVAAQVEGPELLAKGYRRQFHESPSETMYR